METRIPTHPGDVLKEELESRHISQRKFAELINVPYTQLNEILNGMCNNIIIQRRIFLA